MSKALLEDAARQLLRLAERLAATVPPGHVDYISKADASHWAAQLHVNIVEALRAYGSPAETMIDACASAQNAIERYAAGLPVDSASTLATLRAALAAKA